MKRLSAVILSIALACLVPVAAFAAGWEIDETHGVKKYQKPDGQYAPGNGSTLMEISIISILLVKWLPDG